MLPGSFWRSQIQNFAGKSGEDRKILFKLTIIKTLWRWMIYKSEPLSVSNSLLTGKNTGNFKLAYATQWHDLPMWLNESHLLRLARDSRSKSNRELSPVSGNTDSLIRALPDRHYNCQSHCSMHSMLEWPDVLLCWRVLFLVMPPRFFRLLPKYQLSEWISSRRTRRETNLLPRIEIWRDTSRILRRRFPFQPSLN